MITWPAQFQKQGKSLVRPMTWPVYSALLTARWWRVRDQYTGDWVFYTPRVRLRALDRPTSYQTIHSALLQAEHRAGLPHQPYRSLHGGRRHVVSEVIELTGDRMLGLEYVGDVDPKALKSYDRRVPARIAKAAAALDAREGGTSRDPHVPSVPTDSNETALPSHRASLSSLTTPPQRSTSNRSKRRPSPRAAKCQPTVTDGINSKSARPTQAS